MKNKLFIFVLIITLSLPVLVWAADEVVSPSENTVAETEVVEPTDTANVQMLDEDTNNETVTINQEVSKIPYKTPIGKRKLIKMLLKSMAGVGISCILIYLMLATYNNIRGGYINKTKTPEGEASLDIPDDMDSAVKIFLEKTKWS